MHADNLPLTSKTHLLRLNPRRGVLWRFTHSARLLKGAVRRAIIRHIKARSVRLASQAAFAKLVEVAVVNCFLLMLAIVGQEAMMMVTVIRCSDTVM